MAALQAHPETVLDLLFDARGDSAQALGREILSAGAPASSATPWRTCPR